MGPLDLVQLTPLMNRTGGGPEINVGLIDGPVTLDLPDLAIFRLIPVAACDLQGRPLNESNLGSSIGRRGLMAPGVAITSLGTKHQTKTPFWIITSMLLSAHSGATEHG